MSYYFQLIKMGTGNFTHPHSVLWKQAYILRRAQCGLEGDLDPEIYKPTEVTFQMYTGN